MTEITLYYTWAQRGIEACNLHGVPPTQQKDFGYIYILVQRGQSPIKEAVNTARCLIRELSRADPPVLWSSQNQPNESADLLKEAVKVF